MADIDTPAQRLSKKLAQVAVALMPFQALEYDPETDTASVLTELFIASEELDLVTELVSQCRADEQLSVKRHPDGYRILLVRHIKLSAP
jgi:hypothetical protein